MTTVKEEREKLAQMIAAPFWAYGYSVTETECFASGAEFLHTFSAGKYDVIFLDIFLEILDGIETAKKIRENDSVVRLIFVTASNDFASESYMVHADGYWLKPYNEELLQEMVHHLDLSSLEAERIIHFYRVYHYPNSSPYLLQ